MQNEILENMSIKIEKPKLDSKNHNNNAKKYKDLESMCDDINENNLNINKEWIESKAGKEW
ncbi:hypothetical protein DCO58_04915 [Helicobacter saguini]|uniref:Uncharacterized protein n=1 Tax=Helicobacter saguini TaxID=1548018 RepID=A0A347VSY9_9HELI|nr:hypothetical protein [Helicobacter saguini]MWV62309.1 hypothetical protein [Helicobacter saguini]MWV67019.1 hypothetical protein [Helicobacter saguini]MWV69367.1 hypothetical protein [Helicobacter saguini]MWV71077.1 hypothetical protein [Helicobacter saguini]TLD95022.1 hypothetical protein LS64_003675 [Helicobacter saguini]